MKFYGYLAFFFLMAILGALVYIGNNTDKYFDYEQIVDVNSIGDVESVYVIIPKGAVIEEHIAFIPEEITVVIGINNTITWINEDDAPHSVTPDHREYQFGSLGVIKSGESYSYTFENVGVFPYHMEPHPWMTGTVIVLDS